MSGAEIFSGTVSEFVSVKRHRHQKGTTENCDCLRVADVQDAGGVVVAPSQTITICNRLRELGPEPGDVLQFMGQLTPGRGHFFAFRKLPPR